MDQYKDAIILLLKKQTDLPEVVLEVPPDRSLGDYAFPCFALSKQLKKSPVEIAKDLAKKLPVEGMITKIMAVGPYINFFIDKQQVGQDILKRILKEKDQFGVRQPTKKKVILEYPSPNTNKPLHLGHVRNMVLGSTLANLLKANGNTVIQVNLNNDRGVHICKSMLAYQRWGKGETPEKAGMKSDFFVGKQYVEFARQVKDHPELEEEAQKMLEQWEQGDKEVVALWKKMNSWAFEGFRQTYKTFSIFFDKEYYESDIYKEGKEIIQEGYESGMFLKEDNGAISVDLERQGLGKKILLRANGTSVYITQDIYLAKKKYDDFAYDQSIYITATEQNHHFRVLFEILKTLKFPFADRCYHFSYGMVNLTTGRMKSREGTVVDADELVAEMEGLAAAETRKRHPELPEKDVAQRSHELALAAIRFYLLKYDSIKDITFNKEESISFEGETGPYVQYVYARINSIFRKHGSKVPDKADLSVLKETEETTLITILSTYESVVKEAGEKFYLHTIARYVLDLSQAFNTFYHQHQVITEDETVKQARLVLCKAVQQVLKNGLAILGVGTVEEM